METKKCQNCHRISSHSWFLSTETDENVINYIYYLDLLRQKKCNGLIKKIKIYN